MSSNSVGQGGSVSREKLALYDRLKQEIIEGLLKPGEHLVESTLADRYRVSRTPVREALTRLEHDGLVKRSDRGLIVRDSSPGEILDLYDARIALEQRASAVAAERRTDYDLMVLRRAQERMSGLTELEPDLLADINRDFHRAVWAASHSEPLIDLLERVNMHLMRYPVTTLTFENRREEANREHTSMIAAIEARNSNAAAEIARIHFTRARDIRLRLWELEYGLDRS